MGKWSTWCAITPASTFDLRAPDQWLLPWEPYQIYLWQLMVDSLSPAFRSNYGQSSMRRLPINGPKVHGQTSAYSLAFHYDLGPHVTTFVYTDIDYKTITVTWRGTVHSALPQSECGRAHHISWYRFYVSVRSSAECRQSFDSQLWSLKNFFIHYAIC